MKVLCKQCGESREIMMKPGHETPISYEKRRPTCKKCKAINRLKLSNGRPPNWKGGKTRSSQGYPMVWVDGEGYAKEHVVVWEKHHGEIPKGSVIHHIDEDKQNNNIENLACVSKKDHDKLNRSLLKNHWNRRLMATEDLCEE